MAQHKVNYIFTSIIGLWNPLSLWGSTGKVFARPPSYLMKTAEEIGSCVVSSPCYSARGSIPAPCQIWPPEILQPNMDGIWIAYGAILVQKHTMPVVFRSCMRPSLSQQIK